MKTDSLDRRIIRVLNADGRCSSLEIARQLDVSEGTIRNRIKKMNDAGLLRVSALLDPEKLEEKELALLGIRISSSRDLVETTSGIADLPQVKAAYITTGRYDIIVEVLVEVKTGLIDFIAEELTKFPGIVSTESFMAMKSFNKWVIDDLAD